MRKKSAKSPRLRDFDCVVCGKHFQNRMSPSEVLHGRARACSRRCGMVLTGFALQKGETRFCVKCHRAFYCKRSEDRRGHIRRHCSRKCFGSERKFRKMSTDGYWVIHVPYGDVKEHRFVMEQCLGRRLLPTEIVHHINGNQLDNRLDNLVMMTLARHNKIHRHRHPR